ncbi:MAG: hypothetical protein IT442_13045 [Phycisphaeraceae bacterium]|nr:hypothetical protein [Phycisphaeraceae bacterium]
MSRYLIFGLGLLVGVPVTWAGDDNQTNREGTLTQEATEDASEPTTASASAALRDAMARARPRLQAAIDLSRELAGKAEEPDTEELKRAAAMMRLDDGSRDGEQATRFPRESHLAKYAEARPWAWFYAHRDLRCRQVLIPQDWPRLSDAAGLRGLLEHGNPEMRAMAAEALATLHQPEDVARLGRLLDDAAAASPFLGYNMSRSARELDWGGGPTAAADRLVLTRSWHKESVAQCARRALGLMTGERFDNQVALGEWWKVNSDARGSLWYWQQRLERELNEADISTSWPRLYQRPDETWERYIARQEALKIAARAEVHRTIAAELRRRPPEVEAKVRLLTVSDHAGGSPITGSESQFWPDPPDLRVSSDRLLDLLDRKDMWPDVPWDDGERGMYNLLAERLGMWAIVLFQPSDVPRLRGALKREHDNLWWSGQAGMIIGISRLLPPASGGTPDDPDTRDGFLQQAVLSEAHVFVREYCAMEMARVGLPKNATFLKDVAFATRNDDQSNRVAQGILQALSQAPLTPQKRQFLIDLLRDPRFELYWTRPNTQMGMDMCRQYGIRAVNAHAGRKLINDSMKRRLTDPAESDQALAELRQLVAQLGNLPTAQPTGTP